MTGMDVLNASAAVAAIISLFVSIFALRTAKAVESRVASSIAGRQSQNIRGSRNLQAGGNVDTSPRGD